MHYQSSSHDSLRLRFFSIIWMLLYPIRAYLRWFPLQRGKGYLLRYCVVPLLPSNGASFESQLPGGGSINLEYRETLGLSSLLYGTFELAELKFVSRYLQPGDVAFDIGANVGIYSVVLGCATGEKGMVVAVEPVPSNTKRLKCNLQLNQLHHIQILPIALGDYEETLDMNLAEDAAYHSFGPIEEPFCSVHTISVGLRRLDDVWSELGRPKVDFLKLDVEGSEQRVLSGGVDLIKTCRPVVLVEANSPIRLECLKQFFYSIGFVSFKPAKFVAHNYLFHVPEVIDKLQASLK